MDPKDDVAANQRALAVLRAWVGGSDDNLPMALHEAQLILDEDGGPDRLLAGLITAAGFFLVNLEQHGQPPESTLAMLERFVRMQAGDT
jgi:hypothetical protein